VIDPADGKDRVRREGNQNSTHVHGLVELSTVDDLPSDFNVVVVKVLLDLVLVDRVDDCRSARAWEKDRGRSWIGALIFEVGWNPPPRPGQRFLIQHPAFRYAEYGTTLSAAVFAPCPAWQHSAPPPLKT
jgi:hypothetical protein